MATILIVDDLPTNRDFLVTLLGYAGHRLLEAADGAEALEVARAARPDLVIVDLVMPTMDGYEFVRQLRADPALAATRVIFYTATYLQSEAWALAQACGVQHLITKPAEPEVVLRSVAEALDLAVALPTPLSPEAFHQEHLRVITDKLFKQVEALEREVAERNRAEAEVRRLNRELEDRVRQRTAELEAANKELEAFSYSVSHDLRAPLRAIDGFSRILLEDAAAQLSPEAQRYLQLVCDNTRQMGRLIDDLLAFSRLSRQPLRKRQVEPAKLVQQALDTLRAEREGRRVEITIGDLSICQGDPALLRQVWINLLANALKFTRQREVAVIEVGCRTDKAELVYFVRDNGVGFDMQYAHKLFGVFQRLHRAEEYEGTGVGLAIVQRIIHRHGGRVWAEADNGATFSFTLEGAAEQ